MDKTKRLLLYERIQQCMVSRWVIWALLLCGIVFRVVQYLWNRSLWLDESMLASNILHRSYTELMRLCTDCWQNPVPEAVWPQYAPPGFLWVERFFAIHVGHLEFGLRLFPLICGILSVILFYRLVCHVLAPVGRFVSVLLFGSANYLIYYSSEVKQYSTEALVCVVLLLAALWFDRKPNLVRSIALGILGAASIWFSFTAMFILPAIGSAFILFAIINKSFKQVWPLLCAFCLWAAAAFALYMLVIRHIPYVQVIMDEFVNLNGFWSLGDLSWPVNAFRKFIVMPIGFKMVLPCAVLMLAGLYFMFRDKPFYTSMVLLTVAFALAASMLKKYPFHGRTVLYLAGPAIIFIGAAMDKLWHKLYSHNVQSIAIILFALFLYKPFTDAVNNAANPSFYSHIRPNLEYMVKNAKPDDAVYVYRYSIPPYLIYHHKYPELKNLKLYTTPIRAGVPTRQEIDEQLGLLEKQKRVWLLFSHSSEEQQSYRLYMLYHMDRIGRCVYESQRGDSGLYLYELSSAVN